MNDITAFFAFLKYCLGYKRDMSRVIAGMNWHELYSFASKQALLGLCFDGIERLGEEYPEELKQNPIGRELLMTWMGKAQQIRRQNMKVNAVVGKLFAMLIEDGMRQIIDYYHVVCDFYKVYQKSSKITTSLFFDKASCTRQFESELSLHSLASLFPLKEGSTSHPDPLTLREEGGNRPTRCCDLDF